MKSAITVGGATNWFVDRNIFSSAEIYKQEQERIFRRACDCTSAMKARSPDVGDFFLTRWAELDDPDPRSGRQAAGDAQQLPPSRHEGVPLRRGQYQTVLLPVSRLVPTACTGVSWACRRKKKVTTPRSTRANGAWWRSRRWPPSRARSGRPGIRMRRRSRNIWATPHAALRVGLGPWDAGDGRSRSSAASRNGWSRQLENRRRELRGRHVA